MKLHFIEEPELEFGNGTHVCPRGGISKHQVYDVKMPVRRERLLVGGVGTNENLSKLATWITRCTKFMPARLDVAQPNLYPSFCGFNKDIGYKAELVHEDSITRYLMNRDVSKVLSEDNWNQRVEIAVDLYYRQIKFLAQNRPVDVIVCVIPNKLYDAIASKQPKSLEENIEDQPDDELEMNFRRALKAKTMHLGKPIQLVQELSLEPGPRGKSDDAVRAWDFCTALYYKANQTVPWRLVTNINRPQVCFVGIGFYRSRDKKVLHTSLAQIFDELGNNVILRGTPVETDKDNRRPHLSEEQSYQLLSHALNEYEIAMGSLPGRLVIHKSSNFNQAELYGFQSAASDVRVGVTDFVTILDTNIRLLRRGSYPPYRGMHIELDRVNHILYTRGSVDYYMTYPGKYIPHPLEVRIVESEESPQTICQEILALTKMNWNSTQFDGRLPITIVCARKVGEILKYLPLDENPQISYSFYM
ncbi:MAG: hypothetical protein HS126_29150 [Anaerolineales bacterium]|nr:hypothetical protein [Anaerolineales bacterium]